MGIFKQTIGTLTVSSTTQLTLVGRTVVRLGGLFKVLNSPTLSTAVLGIGGLDTGTIAASTFYYVYAVSNGTAHGIVASTSNQLPTGFTRYKKVGAFYTDSGSLVFKVYNLGEINVQNFSGMFNSAGALTSQSQPNWVLSSSISSNIHTINFNSGLFSAPPVGVANSVLSTNTATTFLNSASTTSSISFMTRETNTGAALARTIYVEMRKQGIDAVQPDWKDY